MNYKNIIKAIFKKKPMTGFEASLKGLEIILSVDTKLDIQLPELKKSWPDIILHRNKPKDFFKDDPKAKSHRLDLRGAEHPHENGIFTHFRVFGPDTHQKLIPISKVSNDRLYLPHDYRMRETNNYSHPLEEINDEGLLANWPTWATVHMLIDADSGRMFGDGQLCINAIRNVLKKEFAVWKDAHEGTGVTIPNAAPDPFMKIPTSGQEVGFNPDPGSGKWYESILFTWHTSQPYDTKPYASFGFSLKLYDDV